MKMVLAGLKAIIKNDDKGRRIDITVHGGSFDVKQTYYHLCASLMGDNPFGLDMLENLADAPDIPVLITFYLYNYPARDCKKFRKQLETQCPSVFSEVVIDKSCY